MAVSTTAGDITKDVIVELSQVPGLATQIYAAGRIIQFVQDAYQFEIIDQWWAPYMCYLNVPLDGTTGRLASDLIGPFSTINRYEDIAAAWPEGNNTRLRELPTSINPYTLQGGSMMQYMSPDNTLEARPMRVWPPNSTGNIVIFARQHSDVPMNTATKIYLDRLLMTYDAAWMYCVDDGTVPAQVQKYQMLAAKRREQLRTAFAQQPLPLDPRYAAGDSMDGFGIDNTFFVLDQDPLA